MSRLRATAAEEGYGEALGCSGEAVVTLSISSPGLDGLTESDFVLAAKLDAQPLSDLVVVARRRTTYY